jgi:hypothetical protein
MSRFNYRIVFGASFMVLISCSIVKDSDITSIAQLNTLTLKSFEIVQNAQTGNSSALATLLYDSAVNRISGGTGAHVSRVKAFALPALGNYKMKLKSGTTSSTTVIIAYKDNGFPNALVVYQGDSAVEKNFFFYNTTNQLIRFVENIDPVDNLPPLLHIRDEISYLTNAVYPQTITRYSTDASLAGTFTVCQNCSNGSSSNAPTQVSFQGQTQYQVNFNNSGNCSNNNFYPYPCGGINRTNSNGGGQTGNGNQLTVINNFTFDKTIQTQLTSESNVDSYYFHAIMIVKDVVPHGDFFFWFYSVDWFQTGNAPLQNDDMVKINFNYGQ